VNHRQDIDPEAVSDRPPFGHQFVGVWPDIKYVPITNADGTDNIFGRNRSVSIDTIAVRNREYHNDGQLQLWKARSAGQKRHRESPGFDSNYEFNKWLASQGDVTGGIENEGKRAHRRVTFEQPDDAKGPTEPTTTPFEEPATNEWGVDSGDSSHPSTEHRERVTWRLAPSRRFIKLTEGRHQESYDLDRLPFQAGSYASYEEETDYFEADIDSHLIKKMQLEAPEEDYHVTEPTDDKPGQAYTTPPIGVGDLANEPEETESTPQAAIDTCEDTRIVETAPEIEIATHAYYCVCCN